MHAAGDIPEEEEVGDYGFFDTLGEEEGEREEGGGEEAHDEILNVILSSDMRLPWASPSEERYAEIPV